MANRTKGELNLDMMAELDKAFNKSVFELKKSEEEWVLYENILMSVAETAAKVDLDGKRFSSVKGM